MLIYSIKIFSLILRSRHCIIIGLLFLCEFLFFIFQILVQSGIYVFFFVCVFLSPEKFTCHSLIRFQSCFFFLSDTGKEKKTAFSFIHQNFSKNAQKRTYPRKEKNTLPLSEPLNNLIPKDFFRFPRKVNMPFIHSISELFFFRHRNEKKTDFSFIHEKFPKNAQKRTYSRKKNTVPLRKDNRYQN